MEAQVGRVLGGRRTQGRREQTPGGEQREREGAETAQRKIRRAGKGDLGKQGCAKGKGGGGHGEGKDWARRRKDSREEVLGWAQSPDQERKDMGRAGGTQAETELGGTLSTGDVGQREAQPGGEDREPGVRAWREGAGPGTKGRGHSEGGAKGWGRTEGGAMGGSGNKEAGTVGKAGLRAGPETKGREHSGGRG